MRILWEFSGQISPKSKIESKEKRFQKKNLEKKYNLGNVPMAKNFDTGPELSFFTTII